MNLNWLLFTRSGKNNRNRLALVSLAVTLGMLMVFAFAGGINALLTRGEHSNWRYSFYNNQAATKPIKGVDPLKGTLQFNGNLNKYQDTTINVTSMYATGNNSPQLPDLSTPKPGEYYVSKGLEKIIKEHPKDNIGKRFGKKQIGLIPDKYVVSPDSLEIIRGMNAQEMSSPNVLSIYSLDETSGISPYSIVMALMLFMGAIILFVPIVIFLVIATQLGSVQREQRYATLRLIGATRRQITQIITFESLIAALGGIAMGTILFLLTRGLLGGIRVNAMRFWPGDITVSLTQYIGIVIIILLLCIGANWWGMRRVQLSPLGVVRKQIRTKQSHIISLAPLAIGLVMYAWMATIGRSWVMKNSQSGGLIFFVLLGLLLVMFGLLLSGPYLTRVIAQFMASHTHNASTLIATKRIETQSRPVFRSVSGVVLALFAGSFYLTTVSGISVYSQKTIGSNGYSQLKPNTAIIISSTLPSKFNEQLQSELYIKKATEIYSIAGTITVMPCSVANIYTAVKCPKDTEFVGVNLNSSTDDTKWFGATVDDISEQLIHNINADPTSARESVPEYLVRLNSNNNIDRLRNFVANNVPSAMSIEGDTFVVSGSYAQNAVLSPLIKELASLVYIGIGVTLLVAIASLIVSTLGGLFERQRSFVTLRLGGMNVAQMRRTVLIESLIPLLSTSLLSAGIGYWLGSVFLSLFSGSLKAVLQPSYFAIVGGSLVLAMIAIYSVLPILDKITLPEANQTE